jgi:Flp pilus assembly protein TadD
MAAKGDDGAAAKHIGDALSLDPEHPAALNQLGMLERRHGRFVEAESAYMKAVTASPDYALAHYNLGVLNELYLQRLDTALAHFERYLEVGGDDEQVTKWVADLKRRLGTYERTANVTE